MLFNQKRLLFLFSLFLYIEAVADDYDYIFAADTWPPYYGPQLNKGGVLTEIIQEAYQLQDKKVFVVFTSWKRALELSKKGQYHAMFGAYPVPEREPYFQYSSVICRSRMYLFSKHTKAYTINTIEDLSKLRVGIVRGYYYSEAFEQADFLNKQEAVSDKVNIKLLIHDRIDLIVIDDRVLQHYINTTYPLFADQYRQYTPVISDDTVHLAISKAIPNTQQLYQEFEQGFAKMKTQGRVQAILQAHGFAPLVKSKQ
ncbi:substrate-binding periplasmic protein [Zooshikella harenae]|uniref:Transporter substrate-binding domain-containing protein n=1 Tax=Zooshikella harenae TaxID=2827238 RepID=A0ABS5ZJQ0_9GAMM|nr:transporter substrate-binding domain-containing protein [Zooshikella harenae]MBU2714048.1 transporter substrate-binding domain-containing protein [Zooshikella harenae]